MKASGERDASSRRRVFVRLSKGEGIPRRDILSDLCRLMEARYMIAERVYFHHTKVVAGAMLGRAIQEHVLAEFGGEKHKAEDWICSISDEELLSDLRRSTSEIARNLSNQVAARTLYKTVGTFTEAQAKSAQSLNRNVSIEESLRKQLLDDADQRRRIEDELSAVVLGSPGDVLIYAPPTRMNLKVARMRVLWNGRHTTFKKIDDPIVHTRLTAVEDAHKMLWCVNLIARGLSEDKKVRLNRYFAARFFEADPEKSKRATDRVLRDVVEEFMVDNSVPQPSDPLDRRSKVDAVVVEMSTAFHGGKGTFKDRLEAAVRGHFGYTPSAG
jgi:hypothetical protein